MLNFLTNFNITITFKDNRKISVTQNKMTNTFVVKRRMQTD